MRSHYFYTERKGIDRISGYTPGRQHPRRVCAWSVVHLFQADFRVSQRKQTPKVLVAFLLNGRPLVVSLSSGSISSRFARNYTRRKAVILIPFSSPDPQYPPGTASNLFFSSRVLLDVTNSLPGMFWFLCSCCSLWGEIGASETLGHPTASIFLLHWFLLVFFFLIFRKFCRVFPLVFPVWVLHFFFLKLWWDVLQCSCGRVDLVYVPLVFLKRSTWSGTWKLAFFPKPHPSLSSLQL